VLCGKAGHEPARATQPRDEAHEAKSHIALTAGEEVESAAALKLDTIHRTPQLNDVIAESGVSEWLDGLIFKVRNEGLNPIRTHVRSVSSSSGVSMLLTAHRRRC
jgi:hypothetical protein